VTFSTDGGSLLRCEEISFDCCPRYVAWVHDGALVRLVGGDKRHDSVRQAIARLIEALAGNESAAIVRLTHK
jgi:hypothetical protein